LTEIFSKGCEGLHSSEDGKCYHCEAKVVIAKWNKDK